MLQDDFVASHSLDNGPVEPIAGRMDQFERIVAADAHHSLEAVWLCRR